MTDQNLLFSPDLSLNLLSKSSPSQLQPFQLNRSRTQPALPTEAFYVSSQKPILVNNNNNNNLKPSNLSHVPCKFYKQGTCTAGANCTFSHSSDLSSESAVCKYFVKGNCKFGTKCALLHTMSPYGNSSNSNNGKNNNSRMMVVGTPPQPQSFTQPTASLSFTGRRKTSDQMMNYSTSSNNNYNGSFLHDPFASSAPSMSLFQQYGNSNVNGNSIEQQQQQVWRNQNQRTNMISNDFIGLRSSPRESDHLLSSSSPFRTPHLPQSLSTSMRSNSGYFNNNNESGYRRQASSYITPGSLGNNGNFNDDYFISKEQTVECDDLNDAMLPSSLNDLFTPTELHVRRARQQEYTDDPSLRDGVTQQQQPSSSFDTHHSNNRVPFYIKSSLPTGYEDSLIEGTAAINIPGGNNSGSSGSGSSESYLQQREDFSQHDDDVQFFMEDDEAVTYDTKDHKTTAYNNFPSLISLPST